MRNVNQIADGVIIGSRIVQLIEGNLEDEEKTIAAVSNFIRKVKSAIEHVANR